MWFDTRTPEILLLATTYTWVTTARVQHPPSFPQLCRKSMASSDKLAFSTKRKCKFWMISLKRPLQDEYKIAIDISVGFQSLYNLKPIAQWLKKGSWIFPSHKWFPADYRLKKMTDSINQNSVKNFRLTLSVAIVATVFSVAIQLMYWEFFLPKNYIII